jgi:Uncharacterized protein family UPF0016
LVVALAFANSWLSIIDHNNSCLDAEVWWSKGLARTGQFMESLLVSTGVVALAEIGDKTQLLAFILAARFKKPLPIILGILAATVINHGLAGVDHFDNKP